MKNTGYFLMMTLLLALAFPSRPARGDCGSIPFYAPILDNGISVVTAPVDNLVKATAKGFASVGHAKTLSFDPLKVTVFEPLQRAIILWNGEEEILLLSTDQRASERSAVLEVIPLPGKPEVRLGKFATFEEAQRLYVRKNMWAFAHPGPGSSPFEAPAEAGRITFHEKLGAHDLSVAEVVDQNGFVQFVQGYLKDRYQAASAPIRPEFVKIIDSYLAEGFRWFAFDVIVLDGTPKSRDPIEYRFKSDHVFYPLRISALEGDKTNVDLLVFTPGGANRFEGIEAKYVKNSPLSEVVAKDLTTMDEHWTDFFGGAKSMKMARWHIRGENASFKKDVRVR